MWKNAIQYSNERCLTSVTRGPLATELTSIRLENKTQALLVIKWLNKWFIVKRLSLNIDKT